MTARMYVACALVMAAPSAARAEDGTSAAEIIERVGISAQIGDGWNVRYDNHTASSRAVSGGVAADIVVGNPSFGLLASAGLLYDGGTTPDAMTTPRAALWFIDAGLGIEASPYAIIKRKRFELRFHLAARGVALFRAGCDADRCKQTNGEPDFAAMLAGHAGLIAWWGDKRDRGVSLDAVVYRGQLGQFTSFVSPNSAVFEPPVFFIRATYQLYRGKHADKAYKNTGTVPLEMPKIRS